MKEVSAQIATSMSSDFEENTWTFLMPDGFQAWPGKFAIVDKPVYDKMLAALKKVNDAHNVYSENMGMTGSIFEELSQGLAATEGQVV